MMKMPKPKPVVRWMKLAPMLNDEDAKAETRGALNETCTDAQQEYGKDYAAQILNYPNNRCKGTKNIGFLITFAFRFNKNCDMDHLPKDPAILVSSVNMLLRDEEFDTLESLCYNFGTEPKDIKNYLYGHGFVYSEKQKQFRPIGYDQVTR